MHGGMNQSPKPLLRRPSHAPRVAGDSIGAAATSPAPPANLLLAALPLRDRRRFLDACDEVVLQADAVLWEPGDLLRHVYFPLGGVVALSSVIDGHAGLVVHLAGDEDMLGIGLALGVRTATLRATVLKAGTALRMSAQAFRRMLEAIPALRRRLLRYVVVLLAHSARDASCVRFHVLDARLARLLLMTQDHAHSERFHVTQAALARMLGVRRVGVTYAAGALQRRRLLHYSRGDITVVNRAGLEAAACTCYRDSREACGLLIG